MSSTGQNLETQVQKLRAAGCEKIFEEKKSGASKSERHELKTALAYMREGDQFVVTRLDRLARSVLDLIPSVKSSLGQAKAGPEIGYRFDLGSMVVEPRVGAQVIYNFAQETTAAGFGPIGNDLAGPTGARGRAEIGVRAMTSGGIGLDVSGSYDGIGSNGYSAMTGRAMVRVPLN